MENYTEKNKLPEKEIQNQQNELNELQSVVDFNIKVNNPNKEKMAVYRDTLGLDKVGEIEIQNEKKTEAELYAVAVEEFKQQNTEADKIFAEANAELDKEMTNNYSTEIFPEIESLELFTPETV